MDESREIRIYFGTDWGCCQVSLGETKVLAQVSCEVQQPKATRPNEGLLFVNVELSPMGAPHFEVGRQSELAVQLNRLLEKCIKDSSCVDLESLCIVAEEKVWALRVDINVLNHEGNLVDAASAAALTALSHFRCPDVTIKGEETIIHDPLEKDPIPLSLRHYPVCVSYAIFNKGELCGLHLGGSALTSYDIIVQCANRAAKRAAEVVQMIKSALEEDTNTRAVGKSVDFAECIRDSEVLALSRKQLSLQLNTSRLREEASNLVQKSNKRIIYDEKGVQMESTQDVHDMTEDSEEDEVSVIPLGRGSAELLPKHKQLKEKLIPAGVRVGEGGPDKWINTEDDDVKIVTEDQEQESAEDSDENMSSSSDVEVIKEIKFDRSKLVDSIELSGDSEEEETVMLNAADVNLGRNSTEGSGTSKRKSKKTVRNWYPVKQW
ncbi:exosome complex component RRP45-like isoform X2 [Zootermopsis nevadensis]|nr:exosome complex component RRP45-like isoform X2 [Zootermopsis nevadensis]